MRWISAFMLFALAIFSQTVCAHGINEAVWNNVETAEAVLKFFSDFLEYTELFNSDQMDEIKDIADTISVLMDQMILRKKKPSAIFQALDLAFATSIAKLIAQEDQGESLSRKKSAIFDAFKAALKNVTGIEDPVYLNEIRELVSMFTDGLPTNESTSVASQTGTPNISASSFSAQANVQDSVASNIEVKPPSIWIPYTQSQSTSQKLFNQDKSFSGSVNSDRGRIFDSEITQNSQTTSVASSIAVGAEIGSAIINNVQSDIPEYQSLPTSAVLTGTQVLQGPDSTMPNYANAEIDFPQSEVAESSVSKSIASDTNSGNYPLLLSQKSNVVLSMDASLSSSGGESPIGQSSGAKNSANTATGLHTGSDYSNNSPNSGSQSSAFSIFVDSLSDELYYSDAFYDLFESGLSQEEAISALVKLTQLVSEDLDLSDIVNELVESVQSYVSTLEQNSGASEYAVQFSSAVAKVLDKNEVITSETAREDADIFADSVELCIEENPKSRLTGALSNSIVKTENNEKFIVEKFDSFVDDKGIIEKSPFKIADKNLIDVVSAVPSRASRLYSDSAKRRIDSMVSEMFLLEKINSDNLGSIISELGNMIISDIPNLSECELRDQVYSEILSALIHIINTSEDYYQDGASYVDESAAIVAEAMKYLK